MSSVGGTPGHIASAHLISSGAYREVLLDRGNVIVSSDTSSASPPPTQAEQISSVEGRDAIANAHSMSSEAYREVSPGEGGVLGQFNQDVAGQSQQTTRCVDLLIPHAVAAEICAGEAVDGNDSRCRFYHSIIALQKGDLECVQRIQRIDRDQHPRSKDDTVDDKGALRFKGRLVIPAVPAVRRELVRLHHDDPRAGHFGSRKTTDLLKRRFHWENLDSDVQTYVSHCQICLGNRQPRHKPYGALSSLPLPTQPFEEISMDFITKLPPCQHKDRIVDAVLVIVDRFTKVALFVPTSASLTAAELAQLMYEHLECRFGTPLGIVSDRDSLLTSKFWTELSKARQMKQRLSTAYHPQTDGQTERTHQALQHYLRCFSGAEQQWAPLLPEAEFAYNNSVHVTIGVSPFEALYGYHPRMVDYVPSSRLKVQGVHERLSKLAQTRERMYVHWQKAVDSQKKYYDARHQWIEFQVGETVGLSTMNFRFKEGRKLAPRFIPVKVTERIGSQAYKVQLPVKYSRLHDVFPVSLLEKWYSGQDQKVLPLPELVDGEEEWEVQEIVDHKDVGDERKFLVKWAGWPAEYNTWEPREHFANAKKVITDYEKKARQRHRKWNDPDNRH
jgi:transposase InsO family protein